MNRLRVYLISLFISLVFFHRIAVAAEDYGFFLGFRSQSGDFNTNSNNTKSAVGYQLGAIGSLELGESLFFRSGFSYVERPLKISTDLPSTGDADIKLSYFEIPLTLSYKFEDYASVYAGIGLSVRLQDSVSGSGSLSSLKVMDIKSIIMPIILGTEFRFAPQMGANLFFETIPGEVAKDFKNYRAVGANFILFFD